MACEKFNSKVRLTRLQLPCVDQNLSKVLSSNRVKLSVPDGGRLKAEEFTDPNETAWISIRRQEPSARTSFQQGFRRGEIVER